MVRSSSTSETNSKLSSDLTIDQNIANVSSKTLIEVGIQLLKQGLKLNPNAYNMTLISFHCFQMKWKKIPFLITFDMVRLYTNIPLIVSLKAMLSPSLPGAREPFGIDLC